MTDRELVEHHLTEALRAMEAESEGNIELAHFLRAQTKSRLMLMSDKTLWELANITAAPPTKPISRAFDELKARREELRAESCGWEKMLGLSPLSQSGLN